MSLFPNGGDEYRHEDMQSVVDALPGNYMTNASLSDDEVIAAYMAEYGRPPIITDHEA